MAPHPAVALQLAKALAVTASVTIGSAAEPIRSAWRTAFSQAFLAGRQSVSPGAGWSRIQPLVATHSTGPRRQHSSEAGLAVTGAAAVLAGTAVELDAEVPELGGLEHAPISSTSAPV